MRLLWNIQSLIARVERRVLGRPNDYRAILFDDLVTRLDGRRPPRILEIGPRDGKDTRRLVTLEPDKIFLVELSNQKDRLDEWLPSLEGHPIELVYGNIMYDPAFDQSYPMIERLKLNKATKFAACGRRTRGSATRRLWRRYIAVAKCYAHG